MGKNKKDNTPRKNNTFRSGTPLSEKIDTDYNMVKEYGPDAPQGKDVGQAGFRWGGAPRPLPQKKNKKK